jgi:hypothetical protein
MPQQALSIDKPIGQPPQYSFATRTAFVYVRRNVLGNFLVAIRI